MAMAGDSIADRVLGQADFVHSWYNFPDAHKLWGANAVAINACATPKRIYIADPGNSRVLGWLDVTAFSNDSPSDLVNGPPDFPFPQVTATKANNPKHQLLPLRRLMQPESLCGRSAGIREFRTSKPREARGRWYE